MTDDEFTVCVDAAAVTIGPDTWWLIEGGPNDGLWTRNDSGTVPASRHGLVTTAQLREMAR